MFFKFDLRKKSVTKNKKFIRIMTFILSVAVCVAMLPLVPAPHAAEEPCAAIFKNGEFLFAVSTEREAYEVLSLYCAGFYGNDPTFADTVTVESVQAERHMILSAEEAVSLLKEEMFLPVETVIVEPVREVIPFVVAEIPDDSMYIGQRKIVREGVEGVQLATIYNTFKNGISSGRYAETTQHVTKAEPQIVLVGTKPLPEDHGTGEMVNPCTGRFESPFGPRWGRQHKGIDISNATDTPIYAADNGRVVYAGYMSGYGQLVQIDHNNGLVTYYAHLNTMHVSVGDVVAKGDIIGGMGATGNVTGTHLHFEVRQNGTPVDPLNYVSY